MSCSCRDCTRLLAPLTVIVTSGSGVVDTNCVAVGRSSTGRVKVCLAIGSSCPATKYQSKKARHTARIL